MSFSNSQLCLRNSDFTKTKNSIDLSKKYSLEVADHISKTELNQLLGTQIKYIAQGTFGKVYEYISRKQNRIAVKFLKKDEKTKEYNFKLLFLELNANSCLVQAVDDMDHISQYLALIRKVYYVRDDQSFVFIFDLMDSDLNEYANQHFQLNYNYMDEKKRAIVDKIMLGIAIAMDFMHKSDMIHRDLKPENIMMKGDTPVIGDFGLATSDINGFSTIAGTPTFIDPLLVNHHQGTGKSDVYAVGLIYYILLNGKSDADRTINRIFNQGMNKETGKLNPNTQVLTFPKKYKALKNMVSLNNSERPTMSEVLEFLKGLTQVNPRQVQQVEPKKVDQNVRIQIRQDYYIKPQNYENMNQVVHHQPVNPNVNYYNERGVNIKKQIVHAIQDPKQFIKQPQTPIIQQQVRVNAHPVQQVYIKPMDKQQHQQIIQQNMMQQNVNMAPRNQALLNKQRANQQQHNIFGRLLI